MNKYFTELQPKNGEIVLHCNHVERDHDHCQANYHFYMIGNSGEPFKAVTFRRSDGTESSSRWIILCTECYESDRNPMELISAESTWTGDAPVISRDVQ